MGEGSGCVKLAYMSPLFRKQGPLSRSDGLGLGRRGGVALSTAYSPRNSGSGHVLLHLHAEITIQGDRSTRDGDVSTNLYATQSNDGKHFLSATWRKNV